MHVRISSFQVTESGAQVVLVIKDDEGDVMIVGGSEKDCLNVVRAVKEV